MPPCCARRSGTVELCTVRAWLRRDCSCHKHTKPFKHEQSLRNHSRQVHELPINELRALHAPVPQGEQQEEGAADEGLFDTATEQAPKVTEAACDQRGCDVVYTWPEYRQPNTALGVHKAKAHGIRGAKHKGKGGK